MNRRDEKVSYVLGQKLIIEELRAIHSLLRKGQRPNDACGYEIMGVVCVRTFGHTGPHKYQSGAARSKP